MLVWKLALPLLYAVLSMSSAAAQDEKPVPVEQAAYHWPVFRNDLVMVLRVYFPPGRGSNYHIHSLDQLSVQVEAGANAGQEFGQLPTPARPGVKGSVNFTAYSKKTFIHKSTNTAAMPFHNIVVGLLKAQAGSNAPVARPEAYRQMFDNERARAWKIALEPGQSVGAITQKAPGLRIVIDGGEIAEIVEGQPDRGLWLRTGDFYWQEPGAMRGIKNIGTTRIEFAEFELK